jgi:hypothetical protein
MIPIDFWFTSDSVDWYTTPGPERNQRMKLFYLIGKSISSDIAMASEGLDRVDSASSWALKAARWYVPLSFLRLRAFHSWHTDFKFPPMIPDSVE